VAEKDNLVHFQVSGSAVSGCPYNNRLVCSPMAAFAREAGRMAFRLRCQGVFVRQVAQRRVPPVAAGDGFFQATCRSHGCGEVFMDIVKFLSAPTNMMWAAAAVVSGGMLLWPMLRGGSGGAAVDTLRATLMINKENALVLDVREEKDYATGHIINARNVPLVRLSGSTDVADTISKRKDRTIVVCCATGSRGAAAVAALRKMGFVNAYNLSGGLGAWRAAGLPTER